MEDISVEEAIYINTMLNLGQALNLKGAAKAQGGVEASLFLNDLLGKPAIEEARQVVKDYKGEELDDETLEARALHLYEDYSSILRLLVGFERNRSQVHANHSALMEVARALGLEAICLECAATATKLLVSQGVAVTPW